MNKKFGLALVAALFVFVVGIQDSFAKPAQQNDASAFIADLTSKVLAISGDKSKSDSAKEAELTKIMDSVLDVDRIGKFVLGVHWRSATPEQRTRYSKAYHRYLVETYIPKLLRHSSAKVEIKRVITDNATDQTVETEVKPDGEVFIQVDYRLRKASPKDEFKIVDVVAEGISLSATQRADFASIIDQEGLDAFIQRLEIKAGPSKAR